MDTFWEQAVCARAGDEGRRRDDEFVEDAADPEQIDEQGAPTRKTAQETRHPSSTPGRIGSRTN
jgi:hypothetical protein